MWDRSRESSGSARRREQTDLYATILEVVKRHHGRARVTRISYGAGMPVDRLRRSIDRLIALGLLSSGDSDGHTVYEVTVRGQEFLNTYWRMRAYTEAFSGKSEPGSGR
ncbi:MAG: winged helix-turn-helix domain-containing protein [Thermoplasmata archaeon]